MVITTRGGVARVLEYDKNHGLIAKKDSDDRICLLFTHTMLHLFKTLDEQFERLLETASIDEAKSSSRLDNVPYCMQVSDDERARNIHLATP